MADFSEILIRLAHHPPLNGALARAASEKGRARRPAILDIFDNRSGFSELEIVIDQDRNAAPGLSATKSAAFKSPAPNDRVLR